jgi:hypothetical protein
LHSAGAPGQILAQMIIADSEKRWAERKRELQELCDRGELDADELMESQDRHEFEQEDELRAVLGEDGFRKFDRQRVLADIDLTRVGLSESELDVWYQLRKDSSQQQRDLERSRRNGEIDDADFIAQQEEAHANYEERLRGLLGNERYAALNGGPVNRSITADLRRTLAGMTVNDSQLTALTDAQKQWTQRQQELDEQPRGPDYEDRKRAIETARDAEFQKTLGPEAFAAFQKQQDGNYRTLKHFAAAWQLSDGDVDYLYSAMQSYRTEVRDYEQRARALEQQGQQVDWAGVRARIQEFGQKAQKSLETYLGPDRFNKMKRNDFMLDLYQSSAE